MTYISDECEQRQTCTDEDTWIILESGKQGFE